MDLSSTSFVDIYSVAKPLVVESDSGSIGAFSKLSAWLEDCATKSPKLQRSKRQLHSEEAPGSRFDGRRECGVAGREPGRYACLSYCRGTDLDGVVVTSKDNIQTYERGIALSALPKTIQDAAFICKGLRIRYLWVDSLCIVQGDHEDWVRESSQMCNVYSNSWVTIAAQHAKSCEEGFLGPQKFGLPPWQRVFTTRFGLRYPDADLERMLARFSVLSGNDFASFGILQPQPLSTRGWALQETILPNRIIHFNGHELSWECNTCQLCECGHVQDEYRLRDNQKDRLVGGYMMKSSIVRWTRQEMAAKHRRRRNRVYCSTIRREKAPVLGGWMGIVEQYSRRFLTNPSDKLVAITGLAQMVQATLPETEDKAYFAGVFRARLLQHLLWISKEPKPSRSLSPLAPSWSLASLEGPVYYPDMATESLRKSHVTVRDGINTGFSTTIGASVLPSSDTELILEGLAVKVKIITVINPHSESYTNEVHCPEHLDMRAPSLAFAWASNGVREYITYGIARDVEISDPSGASCWATSNGTPGFNRWHRCQQCDAGTWNPDGEHIALKLVECGLDYYISYDGFFLILQRSSTVEGAWQRVGLGVLAHGVKGAALAKANSWGESDLWQLFEGAELMEVRIV
ncbi:heterokaryon incompatibility protein-domain-containing protein [Podospora aff. communis PSN243]|uniref:Heterokaryon incompatibility protein-domain-containing protein n=1 Tax=Podospora aff. communis PSN243 TaxID=3040156 RepID=A0AAV9GPV7_9PEZI|nr:heterokaryon incompatibility protein-domain-containing protein [Podospora aff. communis PSN243]